MRYSTGDAEMKETKLKDGELKKDYVYRRILEMIQSEEIKNGRFPSEPEFSSLMKVSRVTLRSALKRLEQEGFISRCQHYGTRVISKSVSKKILIADCRSFLDTSVDPKTYQLQQIFLTCRKWNIPYDICSLYFLEDPEILASKYSGIIFFGAAISGDEIFIQTILKSGLPTVFIRQDENNIITDRFASVGINVKEAWIAGFNYLVSIGFRRIGTIISSDERTLQRIGFTRISMAHYFSSLGFKEAAGMVVNIPIDELQEKAEAFISKNNPEAIFCYSDYYALILFKILHRMGKKIPEDIAVLGFGIGSDLVRPSLSSVNICSPICGMTAVRLLLHEQTHRSRPVPFINLPFSITMHSSTSEVKIESMIRDSDHNPHLRKQVEETFSDQRTVRQKAAMSKLKRNFKN